MFRFVSLACLAAVVVGCSEYKFKATGEDAQPADDELDEAEPLEDIADTGEEAVDETDGPDESVDEDPCSEVVTAFDIEEVSELQDAVSPFLADLEAARGIFRPWYRDALILNYRVPELGEGESWRISAVDVLVMVATERFDSFADGLPLTVEVYDAADPRVVPAWAVTTTVQKNELSWDNYALPFDAAISGSFSEFTQKGAWLRFDMTEVIPETGMTSEEFVVGIQWEVLSQVAVGYSNFNRACDRNWTELELGSGWNLNGVPGETPTCSWPMLRVEIEHTYTEDC